MTSLMSRRSVTGGYYQLNAIRTILVEEEFGDYNEKAYSGAPPAHGPPPHTRPKSTQG